MCHHPYAEDGVSCSLPKEQTLNFSLPYEKAKKICPKLRFRTDFTRLPRRGIARVWPVTKNVMALLRIPLGSSGNVYGMCLACPQETPGPTKVEDTPGIFSKNHHRRDSHEAAQFNAASQLNG